MLARSNCCGLTARRLDALQKVYRVAGHETATLCKERLRAADIVSGVSLWSNHAMLKKVHTFLKRKAPRL